MLFPNAKRNASFVIALSLSILLVACKTDDEPSTVPVFTTFTPNKGPAGSIITIMGSGFSSNMADIDVTVGTAAATVLTATSDHLTVSVPSGISGGKIAVSMRGVTLQSLTDFIVTDRWDRLANAGGKRDYGITFATNGKGYVGLGSLSQTDFWEYDPGSNVWTQKQDFKGPPRVYSTAFGIATKGYVISGLEANGTGVVLNDVWQYDPSVNNWTQKKDLPSDGRRFSAVSFSIGAKGYLGTGIFNSAVLNDFWEYNSETDSWTEKADFPGSARAYGFAFAIGSKGYVGGGTPFGTVELKTFYEYDPGLDQWKQKSDTPAEADFSYFSSSFSVASKGYVNSSDGSQLWQFNPDNNVWTRKADPPALAVGIGFTIGEYGYLGASYDKNFYRYIPE